MASTPAGACQCNSISDSVALDYADAAFVGKLVRYSGPLTSGKPVDPALWTFKVRRVDKGKVTRSQEVVSEGMGGSCGLELPQQGTFLVFGNTERTLP